MSASAITSRKAPDLISIEDVTTLRVDFKLPETFTGRGHRGQVVEVSSDALPGQQFPAVLDAIDPLVDQNGRAISVRARLDNHAGKLRPGMFVRVRLLFGERKNVAVGTRAGDRPRGAADGLQGGGPSARRSPPRSLGLRRAAQVEIVDGLVAGDVVVTAGQLKLRDGVTVRAIGEATPGALPPAGMQGMSGMEGMAGMSGMAAASK